ncbi:hypothetical protein QBC46DRAFT_393095 [Diplogelasinospora grovesii]|uniref:Secreted protein n=1 Tax=Diplogelasinospora grovesii TaxID=303347 RepID=A0AAN6N1B5_9PEZI|nr:hypothetical protein QBC46DRAFT_393095 [Diplogelasinospora grovesii]
MNSCCGQTMLFWALSIEYSLWLVARLCTSQSGQAAAHCPLFLFPSHLPSKRLLQLGKRRPKPRAADEHTVLGGGAQYFPPWTGRDLVLPCLSEIDWRRSKTDESAFWRALVLAQVFWPCFWRPGILSVHHCILISDISSRRW